MLNKTYIKAIENIREATKGWTGTKLDNGFAVPEPDDESQYGGKFLLPILKTLHARLATEVEKEGFSPNQYVLYRLSV